MRCARRNRTCNTYLGTTFQRPITVTDTWMVGSTTLVGGPPEVRSAVALAVAPRS
jgi:hypothetical protein